MSEKKQIEVVAAIVRDGDKIFATQRGYGEFKDGWEFPGGKIKMGESHQEALIREIKEELDTTIEVGELVKTVDYEYPTFFIKMHCYMATVVEGDLVLREHEASKWVTKETIDDVDWLPADLVIIDDIKARL